MRKPASKDDTFFNMAFDIAELSKDDSTQCGAILVGEGNVILATGYNGPPSQLNDADVPWNKRPEKYAYIIHAEENALLFALASHGGEPLIGSKVYVTTMPCTECVLRMIRCGVSQILVPSCYKPYAMSKYQVNVEQLLSAQTHPKLNIKVVPYDRR